MYQFFDTDADPSPQCFITYLVSLFVYFGVHSLTTWHEILHFYSPQKSKSLLFTFVIVNANVAFTIECISTLAQCDVIANVVITGDVIVLVVVGQVGCFSCRDDTLVRSNRVHAPTWDKLKQSQSRLCNDRGYNQLMGIIHRYNGFKWIYCFNSYDEFTVKINSWL